MTLCSALLFLTLSHAITLSVYCMPTDVIDHLGNISPFHEPQPATGFAGGPGTGMADDCSLVQVQLMHRHGSRLPQTDELAFITDLSDHLNDPSVTSILDSLSLPSEWSFVQGPNRWQNVLGHDDLTSIGKEECFNHGVQLRNAYPTMPFKDILAGDVDRVVECAMEFREGMFGASANSTSTLSIVEENNVTISSISPWETCPLWTEAFANSGEGSVSEWDSDYLPSITERLNSILSPVQLTNDEVHGALFACAYELAAFANMTWCNVFNQDEIEDFEYENDLLLRQGFGYGLPNNMGQVLGSLFVDNLVTRLVDATAPKTFLEFGHDTTIDIALTGLGLAKDQSYPVDGPINSTRLWRTSNQVPFAAMMVWEKWNCGRSTQIRLLLNNEPFSLAPICPIDETTGACELIAFLMSPVVEKTHSITWGDSTWNSTCGNPGF